MNGIEYPVLLKDIDRFEKQNQNISVSVFGLDKGNLSPMRIADTIRSTHVQLGMLNAASGKSHYFLIKDLSALVGSQISRHNGRKLICERCLNPFHLQSALDKHIEVCAKFKGSQNNLKYVQWTQ